MQGFSVEEGWQNLACDDYDWTLQTAHPRQVASWYHSDAQGWLSSKNCIQTLESGPEEFSNHVNQGKKIKKLRNLPCWGRKIGFIWKLYWVLLYHLGFKSRIQPLFSQITGFHMTFRFSYPQTISENDILQGKNWSSQIKLSPLGNLS